MTYNRLMFTSELKLNISPESVQNYIQMAHRYLCENSATLNVEKAGADEEGQLIYGICLRSQDGQEEWYDPNELDNQTFAGWINEELAKNILETSVLPNLGYSIHQRDLQKFHQNMVVTDE